MNLPIQSGTADILLRKDLLTPKEKPKYKCAECGRLVTEEEFEVGRSVLCCLAGIVGPFRAFPAIHFPNWLRDLGFEDESWRNDAAGRAVKWLTSSAYDRGYPCLEAYVAEERREDREMPDVQTRFWVGAFVHFASGEGEVDALYAGEDENECEVAIKNWLRFEWSR